MAIDLWTSWNFTSMKDIIRTYNSAVRFSKFTLDIKIYKEFGEKFCSSVSSWFSWTSGLGWVGVGLSW